MYTHTIDTRVLHSLAPGEFQKNFRYIIFKRILVIDGWSISCEIALIWMSLDLNYEKSTLVQVMAWCHQAISHYLSQCWPRSLSPYGVTRPQWVNPSPPGQNGHPFAGHIFKCIFLDESGRIPIQISLKKDSINKTLAPEIDLAGASFTNMD